MPASPVVVGAAIVRDGPRRLLAAQRARPPALAGRWELPGGKVEPGEDPPRALARECREELGVEVDVGARVGPRLAIPGGGVLVVYGARLRAGEPAPLEHAALRWLGPDELDSVPWLPADEPLLPYLRALLTRSACAP